MISSSPIDVKDLLNEGSLGMFGDRYSHLMHELQVIKCFSECISNYNPFPEQSRWARRRNDLYLKGTGVRGLRRGLATLPQGRCRSL